MRPEKPFAAPWHAQTFALTVALNEAGHFSWSEWAALFGPTLKSAAQAGPLDGSDDYYTAWVTALEQMMLAKGFADVSLLSEMKSNWSAAYLATPHGQPVHPEIPKTL